MSSRCRSKSAFKDHWQDRSEGFSLLEVLIAMACLVFISFGIFQATTQTYRLRDILMNEGDFYNGIRLSLDILQRDVALMYSPVLMLPTKEAPKDPSGNPLPGPPADSRDMQVILSSDLGRASQYWAAATDKTGVRPSRFVGTDTTMSFISLSHLRIYKDARESEFAKISYELRPEEGGRDSGGSMVLYKIESANAFDDDDGRDKPLRRSFPLLHGITKFKYRYYQKERDLWHTSWDSDKEDFKNIYPDIVEVSVSVAGPSRLNFEGVYRFRPEVPLHGLQSTI